jgi:DNA-binding XRE family transcriptional regulator
MALTILKFEPNNELSTREWFAINAGHFGYEILVTQTRFPDYTLQDTKGQLVKAEAEYLSASFIAHGHDPLGCDLVVCWKHTTPIGAPVLELSTGQYYEAEPIVVVAPQPRVKNHPETSLAGVRANRALSIRELAKLARVAPRTVYGIEHGEVVPNLSTIRKLADALGVEPLDVDEFRVAIERTIRGKETALASV